MNAEYRYTPEIYFSGHTIEWCGFSFNWSDWLLCNIAFEKGNPIHKCIATDFRIKNQCIIWNSSYDPHEQAVKVNELWYFEPIIIINSKGM